MTGLRSYADRRLELGDMIRAALYLARQAGDEQAEHRARDLLARLAADRFRLAVVGQFSRGKSTLMNALLGGAYLPMGAVQCAGSGSGPGHCAGRNALPPHPCRVTQSTRDGPAAGWLRPAGGA